jgi:hypothetical protein
MDGWMDEEARCRPSRSCKVSSANVRSRYWPPAKKDVLPPSVPTTLLVALDQLVTK